MDGARSEKWAEHIPALHSKISMTSQVRKLVSHTITAREHQPAGPDHHCLSQQGRANGIYVGAHSVRHCAMYLYMNIMSMADGVMMTLNQSRL